MTPETRKLCELYRNHNISVDLRYLKSTSISDTILIPTCLHFTSKNPSKIDPGGLRRHLESVLRRLGGSWRRLGSIWRHFERSWTPFGDVSGPSGALRRLPQRLGRSPRRPGPLAPGKPGAVRTNAPGPGPHLYIDVYIYIYIHIIFYIHIDMCSRNPMYFCVFPLQSARGSLTSLPYVSSIPPTKGPPS